jgi:hypothetical protein
MTAPCQQACSPWATRDDLPERCAEADPSKADQAIADATDLLFVLSGYRFPGFCADVVRPCGQSAPMGSSLFLSGQVLRSGQWGDRSWSGFCSCNRSQACGCSRLSEVTLGVYPVVAVTKVMVDGVELDESLYRIDDFKYLVRVPDPDGSNPGWPCCQNLNLDSSEEDTFEVSVTYGTMPDGAGKRAAAAMACQLLRARSGDDCKLPDNVTALTRQGVSMNVQAVANLLDTGATGVVEADRWLRAVNPGGGRPAGVLIPGARSSVRRVGT